MGDLSGLDILNSLLKFRDCSIMDIMTPRKEICAIDIESSKDEVIKKVKTLTMLRYQLIRITLTT